MYILFDVGALESWYHVMENCMEKGVWRKL